MIYDAQYNHHRHLPLRRSSLVPASRCIDMGLIGIKKNEYTSSFQRSNNFLSASKILGDNIVRERKWQTRKT